VKGYPGQFNFGFDGTIYGPSEQIKSNDLEDSTFRGWRCNFYSTTVPSENNLNSMNGSSPDVFGLRQPARIRDGMMGRVTLMIPFLLLAACGCHDREARSQIVGTWIQGTPTYSNNFTITFAPDGTFSSRYPESPKTPAIAFDGTWNIKWGNLILTDCHSNSVPVSDVTALRIHAIDVHRAVFVRGGLNVDYYRN